MTALPTILNKWEHRRRMQRPGFSTTKNIFNRWYHAIQFAKLKRFHRKLAKQIRQNQFNEIVQEAATAANRHDTHRLFSLINRFAPKQPRKTIQLRNHAGQLANPVESAAILTQHVREVWDGPSHMDISFSHAPGVPFTVKHLERAIAMIPATRATARPYAPGIVWRQIAPFLAPLLYSQLEVWWATTPPRYRRVGVMDGYFSFLNPPSPQFHRPTCGHWPCKNRLVRR